MHLTKDQFENIIQICKELTLGIKSLSRYGLKPWRYAVSDLEQKIKKLDDKIQLYVAASTTLEDLPKVSEHITLDDFNTQSLPDDRDSKQILTNLYNIIQEVRNLLGAYHLTNVNFVKAIKKYCKLLDVIYLSSNENSLTDSLLNRLYNQLYRGATYPSISSKFQGEKKRIKGTVATSLKNMANEDKTRRVDLVRSSLSRNDNNAIHIEHAADNSIYFRGLNGQQKKANYKVLITHILEILNLQKKYPLNPSFDIAIGKFIMYLKNSIDARDDLQLQVSIAKQRNNVLSTFAKTTLSGKEEKNPEALKNTSLSSPFKRDLSNEFNNIVAIKNKLKIGINQIWTAFGYKSWNYDVRMIKDNFDLLSFKIKAFSLEAPELSTEGSQSPTGKHGELKKIFDLLFKLMLAVFKLLTKYRVSEVDLIGPFIDYCNLLISSTSSVLREYEIKCLNYQDNVIEVENVKSLKPLLCTQQLDEIFKHLADGANWPSKSAYFSQYKRQTKQEVSAALKLVREELENEVKQSIRNTLAPECLSDIQVKPTANSSFKRYNWGQINNVYEELEFYIFRILELQKWNPLNDSFVHAVEKFITELKNNYDETQNAIRELTQGVHEKEHYKSVLNNVFRITDSVGKAEDKIALIQKVLSDSKNRSKQVLIEDGVDSLRLVKR